MYIPHSYQAEDLEKIYAIIREHAFGTLVTCNDNVPFATHMPFVLEIESGKDGILLGHMAKANPQWRHFHPQQEVLITFQGPHTYISPSWYQGGFNVPTWNYAAVHIYGVPQITQDENVLQTMLNRLIAQHEQNRQPPWMADWADSRNQNLLKAIVGFQIEIQRIEAKFKLSQNKSVLDQIGVIEALEQSTSEQEQAVAAMMAANIKLKNPSMQSTQEKPNV